MTTRTPPRHLTGAALELAAGRMRHPDLARMQAEWERDAREPTMQPVLTESQRQRQHLAEQGIAVVANLKSDAALIEWAKSAGLFVRIDRRSRWGNPYRLSTEAERAAVCDQYAAWLKSQPGLMNALGELRGRVLGCWCFPKRCHGHHLAELANGVGGSVRQKGLFDE